MLNPVLNTLNSYGWTVKSAACLLMYRPNHLSCAYIKKWHKAVGFREQTYLFVLYPTRYTILFYLIFYFFCFVWKSSVKQGNGEQECVSDPPDSWCLSLQICRKMAFEVIWKVLLQFGEHSPLFTQRVGWQVAHHSCWMKYFISVIIQVLRCIENRLNIKWFATNKMHLVWKVPYAAGWLGRLQCYYVHAVAGLFCAVVHLKVASGGRVSSFYILLISSLLTRFIISGPFGM